MPVPLSSDLYAALTTLFQKVASTPEDPPIVPLDRWPAESAEQRLLADLQAALAALQAHNQEQQTQVSKRERQYHLLQHWMEVRMREQATLLGISQTLAAELELKPGLILDQLREIVEYTHAALFALEDLDLVALAVRGSQALASAMPFRIRLAGPEMLTTLLNGHRPTRIADVDTADPSARLLRSLLDQQADALLAGMRAWMWVPLAVKGRVIGGMSIAHTETAAFTAHYADLALTVANQAAITMVNAHLYAQAQALATLEERQRLARNLHDAVNQSLFPAGLIADVLPLLWEQDPEEGRQSLADLRRLIHGAQAELRGLLAELRPVVLTDTELGVLLRQLGDALTGRTNIPVVLTVVGEGALPADVQTTLYRICQEALSNVAKHAAASQVTIDLEFQTGAVALHIGDNGRGFDPDHIPPGHYGLGIMRERAQALGMDFSIVSQPGEGTDVVIRWQEDPQQEEL